MKVHPGRPSAHVVLISATALAASVLISVPPADAYQFNGCRWNHTRIKFSVPAPLVSYPTWSRAAALWSGLRAKYVLNGSRPDLLGTNETRGTEIAWSGVTRKRGTIQTPPACTASGYFRSGQVEVSLNWAGMTRAGYTPAMLRMVAAHELGHAFGLAHTPRHPEWLMYPSDAGRTVRVPQLNDKAGVNALYS